MMPLRHYRVPRKSLSQARRSSMSSAETLGSTRRRAGRGTQNFVKAYQDKYGETPIQFAADAYDCVYAYKQALETANCTPDMTIVREEIFGPVACVIKFHDEDEVIAMANDSVYGLGGAVWTQDINRALRVARAVETGRMWVNTYNMIPAGAPFGGYKQSGIGRETHKVILEHYTQKKNIMINLRETPSGFYPAK